MNSKAEICIPFSSSMSSFSTTTYSPGMREAESSKVSGAATINMHLYLYVCCTEYQSPVCSDDIPSCWIGEQITQATDTVSRNRSCIFHLKNNAKCAVGKSG